MELLTKRSNARNLNLSLGSPHFAGSFFDIEGIFLPVLRKYVNKCLYLKTAQIGTDLERAPMISRNKTDRKTGIFFDLYFSIYFY